MIDWIFHLWSSLIDSNKAKQTAIDKVILFDFKNCPNVSHLEYNLTVLPLSSWTPIEYSGVVCRLSSSKFKAHLSDLPKKAIQNSTASEQGKQAAHSDIVHLSIVCPTFPLPPIPFQSKGGTHQRIRLNSLHVGGHFSPNNCQLAPAEGH